MIARERGYSLLELKVVLLIFSVVLLVTWSALVSHQRADRLADGYAADVLGCRRALEAVEADLRTARTVETGTAGAVRMQTGRGAVEYRRRNGVLERTASGTTAAVARNMAVFRVAPEGSGFRVTLGPGRREGLGRDDSVLTTLVVPRARRVER